MIVGVYRRHTKKCPHRPEGRDHTKCSCPIWIDAMQDGHRLNYSLKTANWTMAILEARALERGEDAGGSGEAGLKPLRAACEEFLKKLAAEHVSAATLKKYRAFLLGTPGEARSRQEVRYTVPLATFAANRGVRYVQAITLGFLESFRVEWKDGPVTARKRLDRLRAFLDWCVAHGWLAANPSKHLRPPIGRAAPTMPYTREEMRQLLKSTHPSSPAAASESIPNRRLLRLMILLARFTGLRIGDLLRLRAESFDGNRVMLYQAKTGCPVFVPVPDAVMREFAAVVRRPEGYWFWNGRSGIDATAEVWRRRLKLAAEAAGVPNAGWHRFRDTFAVELLLAGVPLERVSVLLGHQSIRITERHYSPWVSSRQVQLEDDVRRSWAADDPEELCG